MTQNIAGNWGEPTFICLAFKNSTNIMHHIINNNILYTHSNFLAKFLENLFVYKAFKNHKTSQSYDHSRNYLEKSIKRMVLQWPCTGSKISYSSSMESWLKKINFKIFISNKFKVKIMHGDSMHDGKVSVLGIMVRKFREKL